MKVIISNHIGCKNCHQISINISSPPPLPFDSICGLFLMNKFRQFVWQTEQFYLFQFEGIFRLWIIIGKLLKWNLTIIKLNLQFNCPTPFTHSLSSLQKEKKKKPFLASSVRNEVWNDWTYNKYIESDTKFISGTMWLTFVNAFRCTYQIMAYLILELRIPFVSWCVHW